MRIERTEEILAESVADVSTGLSMSYQHEAHRWAIALRRLLSAWMPIECMGRYEHRTCCGNSER